MSLTYAQYITTIANECVFDEADSSFVQIMPQTIAYAEGRIYRELDLLATVVRDSSGTCAANSRNFTLPQSMGRFEIVKSINVITPSTATVTTGTRNPVTPAAQEVIDGLWPSETAALASTVPALFAMITDQAVIFGPPPGAAFPVEVTGFIVPTPLSETNTTTYLSLYLSDLFVAASMVFMSGFMRNFSGAGSDDPQMAVNWESQYRTLFTSANVVDARQKFASSGWTSTQPEPAAQTPR